MIYYASEYSTTSNNIHFKIIKNNTKFIYYYLFTNIYLLENGFTGSNQKKITKDYLNNVNIPLFPYKIQEEIVEYIDNIESEKIIIKKKIDNINFLMKRALENSYK